jgi:hypothetical protein
MCWGTSSRVHCTELEESKPVSCIMMQVSEGKLDSKRSTHPCFTHALEVTREWPGVFSSAIHLKLQRNNWALFPAGTDEEKMERKSEQV